MKPFGIALLTWLLIPINLQPRFDARFYATCYNANVAFALRDFATARGEITQSNFLATFGNIANKCMRVAING